MFSQGNSFLKHIITGDEIWIFAFDTEASEQLSA
jgi:hypothetical protein